MKFVLFLITCSTICSTIAAEQSPMYASIHSHDNLYEQEHEYQLKRRRAKESKDNKAKESKDKKSKDDTNYRFFGGVTKFAENGGEDSEIPSSLPSTLPSDSPIAYKSHHPSTRPSEFPSVPPNTLPTITPTDTISTLPTNVPTRSPIVKSQSPSSFPSESPTERPTSIPSSIPSIAVSVSPSGEPTLLTALPTALPSSIPSASPTILASNAPSVVHSSVPSTLASETPSVVQSASPSVTESQNPTSILSNSPSSSLKPSVMPTSSPSSSTSPSLTPTIDPTISINPSFQPSETFSMSPSVKPSSEPSVISSFAPTEEKDARSLTLFPSVAPSSNPTDIQSVVPTSNPSETKSSPPSDIHSAAPSTSKNPTSAPSGIHSAIPSSSIKPSAVPSTTPTSTPASWCKNSENSFPVTNQNGKTSDKTCSWVDDNTDKRCDLEGVRNNCPVSCNYCLCKDNPDVFTTKLSNSRSCQWVSKNLSKCSSVPKAEFNCPLTCGKCTEAPSIAPSSKPSSESPSKAPSVSPSTSWCQDSTEKFSVNIDGTNKKKQCSWLKESKNTRCALEGVSDYCPVTCGSCHCKDNPGEFLADDLTEQTCQWVSEKLSRCTYQPLAEFNCPLTCGKCSDTASMTPSTASSTESPSVTPSTSPSFSLVNISEKVQIQMGPLVNDALMNEDSKDLLEDTLNASFNEVTKSRYMNIRTSVVNQDVTKLLSRRLVGGRQLQQLDDYVNFFDLIVTAQFRPTSTTDSPNANAAIKEFFDSTTYNDKIIVALTNTTSSGAEYFRKVKTFTYIDTDTSQIGNQNDDSVAEPQSSNMMLIIISSASACAALIFILVVFMYTKKRRGRLTEATEQLGDAEVVTTNNASNATQNWEDLQPNQPYSIDVNRQDDGNDDGDDNTDAGRTFNTLEKIYSGESGDQMSFQSYGYSLDDGIVSKQSGPASLEEPSDPLGEFRSGFDSDGSDGPLDVSLSPANDSVYSGLTNEDASYRPMTREKKPSMNRDDVIDEEDPFLHGEALYERVCIAPPGKLGVVIDTTKMGPVVYQVKDGSPLEGVVFPGDRIMAVDDIDTHGMTASNITKIMARKADSERRITVASKKEVY